MRLNLNLISIVLTVRNEIENIADCLDGILNFQIPEHVKVEIIFSDGLSEDGTYELLEEKSFQHENIVLIKNPNIYHLFGFNHAVKICKGDYVLWLGAHTIYPKDYLKILFDSATKHNTDYVGGIIETIPYDNTYEALAVQALTTHPFGVGNSGFRLGAKEGPADTASYGLYKKDIFEKIGYFNEKLIRCQDYEFNCRIRKTNGLVWINPNAIAKYKNQKSLFSFYKKQNLLEAPYNAYMWYIAPYTFAYRHAITGVFSTGVIGGIVLATFYPIIRIIFLSVMILYFLLALFSAVQQAIRYKKPLHILTLPICFFLYHFSHGLGIFSGLVRLATGTAPVQKH